MIIDIGNKKFRVRLTRGQWAAVWVILVGAFTWVVRVEVQLDVLRFRLAECIQQQQQLKQTNAKLAAKVDAIERGQEGAQ